MTTSLQLLLLTGGLLLAGACRTFPERGPDPAYGTVPTETYPQFYGRVPRNVVMISIDTLRRDHLDRYAAEEDRPLMPFLSEVAEQGVPLDDFVQCSNWTYASTSCTLAGRYNFEAGMATILPEQGRTPWPEGTPFLAGYLGEAGYYSVLVSTNGWLAQDWGNTQGYDEWFHPRRGSALRAYMEARERLDAAAPEGPWFLHVHVTEPHASYSPPPQYLDEVRALPNLPVDLSNREYHYAQRDAYPQLPPEDQALLEAHLRARYRAEVRWLDDQLFAIHQDLEATGRLDDTLVVFWTDHGEAFWEHGRHTHAFTLHAEENDAIAVFWAKNIVPSAWTGPTTAIDLAPTVMELLTREVPASMTGIPVGQAPADRPRFAWAIARLGAGQAILKDGYKLMFPWTGQPRLFDRTADPLEQADLYDPADPHPMARELFSELRPVVEQAEALAPGYLVRFPPELEPGAAAR